MNASQRQAVFTIRLPSEDYEALQAMSFLTGRSMSELTRSAIQASVSRFAASGEVERLYGEAVQAREQAMDKLRKIRDLAAEDVVQHDEPRD